MIRKRYGDYKNLILSRAWAWQQRTGWELEELEAEGNVVFCKAVQTYDPSKSSFSTYLYNALQMHFGNMVTLSRCQKAEKKEMKTDCDNCFAYGDVQQEAIFREMINDLPEDAKEVVKAVFETPAEILDVLGITRVSKNALHQYFNRCRGWSQQRTYSAFKVIQQILS
jgi:DNA-directed RNA polymerase specialized sigma subunit